MDAFAQLPAGERRIYFEQTAARMGVSPQIVEKDFWVCWTLKQLFMLPDIGPHLIFKGGTSLSKVFKIIERFSEDIDVSIARGYLGFGGDNEPEAGSSNKEKQRRIEALKAACQRKIEDDLLPALTKVIQSKTLGNEKWLLRQASQIRASSCLYWSKMRRQTTLSRSRTPGRPGTMGSQFHVVRLARRY